MSELSFIPIYAGMPSQHEALDVYEKAGFVVTGLFAIVRRKSLAVVEMDCMMANTQSVFCRGFLTELT